MAAVELLDRNETLETVNDEPNTGLSREVEQLLEEVRQPHPQEQPRPRHWYYQVACPGVRYYSF